MSPPDGSGTESRYLRRDILATAGSGFALGLAGCGTTSEARDTPPLSGETVSIGVLAPERWAFGDSLRRGAEFAAERINADGGIAGASIELHTADTLLDPARIREEHDRLCASEGCDLTVGLTIREALTETLPSIATHETVHLSTGTVSAVGGERIADDYDRYKYHFRVGLPNSRQLADALTAFVRRNATAYGWERAAILVENVPDLTPFYDRLTERLPQHLDVPVETRASGLSGPGPTFDHIEDKACDVLLGGHWMGGISLINDWAGGERSFAYGGLQLPATSSEFWTETDGNAESVFSLGAVTPESDNTEKTRGFVADYGAQYDRYPMCSGAATYDALRIYRDAVETLVEADDTEFPAQDAIVEALEKTTFSESVIYPEFEFTERAADRIHEPVWESMATSGVPLVQQWQAGTDGGTIEAIGPEGYQTAEYQAPPWLRDD